MVVYMIYIKTKDIEKEVDTLKRLINDYEKNYLYIFKELSDASFYWKEDAHAKEFFNGLKFEKSAEENHYRTIYKTFKVFEYIKNKYKEIGNTILVDIDERDNILAKYNKCIDETNDIIVAYEHLDTSFCEDEKPLILSQLRRLYKLRDKYIKTKGKVKDALDRIVEIEKEVKNKLANYEVDQVPDFDISLYLPEDSL